MVIPDGSRARPMRPDSAAPAAERAAGVGRRGLRGQLRPETILAAAAMLVAAIQAWLVLTTLNVSSFWTDELYSVVIAYQPTFARALHEALLDVHPPLYYLALFYWTQLFGQGEAVTRLPSALAAIAALPVFYFGLKPVASPLPRLALCAVAATTPFWLDQSQTARMYGIGLLEGAVLMALLVKAVAARAEGRGPNPLTAAGLVVTAFLYSFTHYYMFVAAGAVLALLVLLTPGRRWKLFFLIAGAALAATMLGYIKLVRSTTAIDLGATWFSNSPAFLARSLADGVRQMVDPGVAGVLVLASAAALFLLRRRALKGDEGVRLLAAAAFVLIVGMVLVGGLAASLLFAPSFSERNVASTAPFFWAAAAVGLDLGRSYLPRPAYLGACVLILGLAGFNAARGAVWLTHPHREEWRAAGRFVQAQPQCRGAPLPALLRTYGAPPPPSMVDQVQQRNAYYAGLAPDRVLVSVFDGQRSSLSEPARRVIRQRLADPNACPVLMQAVHVDGMNPELVQRELQALAPPGASRRAAVIPFEHFGRTRLVTGAYLFVARP